jgi:hypothetical protein
VRTQSGNFYSGVDYISVHGLILSRVSSWMLINDQSMELKTMKPRLNIHEEVHEMNPLNILEIMGMDPDEPLFLI